MKKICPNYKGAKFYETKPSVSSNNIITANGEGIIEFSYEIMEDKALEA